MPAPYPLAQPRVSWRAILQFNVGLWTAILGLFWVLKTCYVLDILARGPHDALGPLLASYADPEVQAQIQAWLDLAPPVSMLHLFLGTIVSLAGVGLAWLASLEWADVDPFNP